MQHRDRGRNAYGQQRAKRGREERSGGARETPPDPTLHVPRFPGLVLFSPSLDLDTRLKMDELIVSRFRLKRFKMEYLDRWRKIKRKKKKKKIYKIDRESRNFRDFLEEFWKKHINVWWKGKIKMFDRVYVEQRVWKKEIFFYGNKEEKVKEKFAGKKHGTFARERMSNKKIGPPINPMMQKYGLLSLRVLYEPCLHLCPTQLQILKE